jgi:peptidoglycan/LPS O-acetylase OafA/YrhL
LPEGKNNWKPHAESMPLFLAQLAVAIGLASVLHFAVERPFLALKDPVARKEKQAEGTGGARTSA